MRARPDARARARAALWDLRSRFLLLAAAQTRRPTMNKAQAIADIAYQLSAITTPDRAASLIQRALRVTGLSHQSTITPDDVTELLRAIAAEGGPIQEIAQQIALYGLGNDGPAPRTAA
jgi:hypothetical protein